MPAPPPRAPLQQRLRPSAVREWACGGPCAPSGCSAESPKGRRVHQPLERGSRVQHPAFGEGEVLVVQRDEVTAFFPGRGERTVKLSFLSRV